MRRSQHLDFGQVKCPSGGAAEEDFPASRLFRPFQVRLLAVERQKRSVLGGGVVNDAGHLFATRAAFPDDEDPSPKKSGDENPHGLSSGARESLARVSGAGTLRAKRVVFEGLPMTDFPRSPQLLKGALALYDSDASTAEPTLVVFQYNPEQVRRTLEKLALCPELRRTTGGRARAHVLEFHTPARMVEGLARLFSRLPTSGKARPTGDSP